MTLSLHRYITETASGKSADGFELHVELFRAVFQVSMSWRRA